MISIPSSGAQNLEGFPTEYQYALRVTPAEMQDLSREQLLQLCLEQYALLWLIISIVRNKYADISSRIVMIDVLIENVQRCVQHSVKSIVERVPVLVQGDGKQKIGMVERLGMSRNTVSTVLEAASVCGAIRKDYRKEDGKSHLDITLQAGFLTNPDILKKQYKAPVDAPSPKKEPAKPRCENCGSEDLLIICRLCLNGFPEQPVVVSQQPGPVIVPVSTGTSTVDVFGLVDESALMGVGMSHDGIPCVDESCRGNGRSEKKSVDPAVSDVFAEWNVGHGPAPTGRCWGCGGKEFYWNHLHDSWACKWCHTCIGGEKRIVEVSS